MATDNLEIALKEAGELVNKRFKIAAEDKGHKATGELDKSFKYTAVANELKVFSERYADSVSKGISKEGSYKKSSQKFRNSIIEWAKAKGIAPRNKKTGRFITYMAMASAMAIGIRRNGISKRFEYKGSGFIKTVKEQSEKEVMELITEGCRKDLLIELNRKV